MPVVPAAPLSVLLLLSLAAFVLCSIVCVEF
jgi:hypothetical protein